MFALYNKETKKFLYLYAYTYYDETYFCLEKDGDCVYTVQYRPVLERILLEGQCNIYDGSSIERPEIDFGLLDGYEIVELGIV